MADLDALLAAQASGSSAPTLTAKAADPIDALLAAQASAAPSPPIAVAAGNAINANVNSIPRQLGLTARYGLEGLAQAAQVGTEPIRQALSGIGNASRSAQQESGGILAPPQQAQMPMKPLGSAVSQFADAIGLPSPQTANERVIGDASRLVAGAGGMAGAAGAAGSLPGMVGKVMTGLAANPAAQLSSAAGAGLVGGASREAGGGPLTQAGASLIGGVAGGLVPGTVSSIVNAGKSLLTPAMTPQQLDVQLTAVLGKTGQDYTQLPPNVQNALRTELASSLQTGKELDPAAVSRLAAFKTVGATPTRGMISQDPVQITREQNLAKIAANSGDSQLHGLPLLQNQNNGTLIRSLNDAGATAGDPFQAGANIIGSINARDASMKAGVSSLYDTARNMPGGDIPLDRTAVVNGIYDALAKENKMAFLPPEVGNMLNTISKGSVTINGQTHPVPFDANALDNLMTTISTAQRGTQDGNVKAALMLARKAIDAAPISPIKNNTNVVGNPLVTQGTADMLRNADGQAPAFMDALNQARAAHAQRMGWQDSAAPIDAALNGAQPDNFVKRFVVNGSLSDVQAIAQNAPNSGLKEAVLSHLKDKALNGAADEVGKFSQSAYNKALDQIGDRKLAVLFNPDELAQLKAVGRVSSLMQSQPIGSAVNNSNSGALVLGRGADWISSLAGKIPMGKQLVADPLRNINISLSQRGAQNVVPGLVVNQPKPSLMNSLLLPGAVVGGGLLAP